MSTLICTLTLDKHTGEGITIQIKDKAGENAHTIQLNQTVIELTSTDGSATTTTRQTANSLTMSVANGESQLTLKEGDVELECKNLTIAARGTIKTTSSGETSMGSKTNLTLEAKAMAELNSNMTTMKSEGITKVEGTLVKVD